MDLIDLQDYFLSISDKRLSWNEKNPNEINDICIRISENGCGGYFDLHTGNIGFGYKVNVKIIIEFMKKYNVNFEKFLKDQENNEMDYMIKEVETLSLNEDKNINSVDILKKAIYSDLASFNKKVIMHYGFINCKTLEDYIQLGGLYQGLIKHLECNILDLHNAQINNNLSQFILNEYNKIPTELRGEYYKWFLKNKNIVYKRKIKNYKKEEENIKSICILYKFLLKYNLLNEYFDNCKNHN